MVKRWVAIVGVVVMVAAAGCSALRETRASEPTAAAAREGVHEIVVECTDIEAQKTEARNGLDEASEVGPAVVALAGIMQGIPSLGPILALVAGEAMKDAFRGSGEAKRATQYLRVPVPQGAPSATIRKADGSVTILVGIGVSDALMGDGSDGLSKEDIAFWRRIVEGSEGGDEPTP